MSEVPERKLSVGELRNKDRRRYIPKRLQPVLNPKQIRKQQRRKRVQEQNNLPDYHGNNHHISDTAKAWHLSYKETKGVFDWVTDTISPEYRGVVLAKLLRRKLDARRTSI